jgi:hypothetical protein
MKYTSYTKDFYESLYQSTLNSAQAIVPLLIDLLSPRSVIDVGCGNGIWLREFYNRDVKDILGLDGDYIPESLLLIDKSNFMSCDLEHPPALNRDFDLAICLEVAEHLSPRISRKFVNYLVNLSQVVLFSSAIPFQGGANHINLQWQKYWADIFMSLNYFHITTLRARIWDEPVIADYYKQNIVLYVKENVIKSSPRLKAEYEISKYIPLSIVHPEHYISIAQSVIRARKEIDRPIIKELVFRFRHQLANIREKLPRGK